MSGTYKSKYARSSFNTMDAFVVCKNVVTDSNKSSSEISEEDLESLKRKFIERYLHVIVYPALNKSPFQVGKVLEDHELKSYVKTSLLMASRDIILSMGHETIKKCIDNMYILDDNVDDIIDEFLSGTITLSEVATAMVRRIDGR